MLIRSLVLIGSLAVFALVVWVAGRYPANQWDLRTYHTAAANHAAGTNPYTSAAPNPGELEVKPGYTYAPHTLTYFRGFVAMDYRAAAWAYLGVKCVLLVGLVLLWRAAFLRDEFNVWFLPFVLFAFNGATCTDLVSGNAQLFELALLWLAFACYSRGLDLPFGVLVLAAASLRMQPILFLGMFLMAGRGRWIFALILGAAFVAGLVAARAASPQLFRSFLMSVIAVRDEGWSNPTLWPLIQGVRGYLERQLGHGLSNWAAVAVYVVTVAAVAGVTLLVGWRIGERVADDRRARLLQIFLCCFAYVLVVPHLRPSGFMLLLVPAFYFLRHAPPLHTGIALGLLAAVPGNPATGLPYLAPVGVIVSEYYQWLTAALFWGLFCYQYWNGGEGAGGFPALESSDPPRD